MRHSKTSSTEVHPTEKVSISYEEHLLAIRLAVHGAMLGFAIAWLFPSDRSPNTGEFYLQIGQIAGVILSAFLINKIGRYKYLFTADMIYLLFMLTTSRFTGIVYKVGRCIIGFSCGAFTLVVPLFLAEVCLKESRGRLSSYFYLAMTLGAFYFHLMNFITNEDSRIAVAGALLAILTLSGWCFVTESPVYILANGTVKQAAKALKVLRGPGLSDAQLSEELTDMKMYIVSSPSTEDSFGFGYVIYALTLGCLTMSLHAALGKYIVFGLAAYPLKMPHYGGLMISWPLILGAVVPAIVVDNWGRKFLILTSLTGVVVSTALMSWQMGGNMLRIPLTFTYCFAYSMGTGSVPWTLLGEMFPYHVKPFAAGTILIVASAIESIVTIKGTSYWKDDNVDPDIKYLLCWFPGFIGLILSMKLMIRTRNLALKDIPRILDTEAIPWTSPWVQRAEWKRQSALGIEIRTVKH